MVANSANDSDCRRMGGDADWHEVHKGIVLDVRRKRSRYSLQARITVQPHINLQLSDKSRRHLEAFAPLRLELVSSLPVGELTLAQSFKQRIAEFIELGARPEACVHTHSLFANTARTSWAVALDHPQASIKKSGSIPAIAPDLLIVGVRLEVRFVDHI